MSLPSDIAQWILGIIIVMASLGTILSKKPVHSSIYFLLTLFSLAAFYLQLSAEFIAVMQVLVYAGAILVIFIFVMVLFQDSYQQIRQFPPKSSPQLLYASAGCFLVTIFLVGRSLLDFVPFNQKLPANFGTTEHLGKILYIDFFFPFEAVILLFLVAIIGSLYIAKKVK